MCMFEDFKLDHLFEGQIHEQHHFSLTIQDKEYKGMVHDGKVRWYHPHPQQDLEEGYLNEVESKVYDLMRNHLQ